MKTTDYIFLTLSIILIWHLSGYILICTLGAIQIQLRLYGKFSNFIFGVMTIFCIPLVYIFNDDIRKFTNESIKGILK